jgi:hypothetical protein
MKAQQVIWCTDTCHNHSRTITHSHWKLNEPYAATLVIIQLSTLVAAAAGRTMLACKLRNRTVHLCYCAVFTMTIICKTLATAATTSYYH